MRWFGPSWDAPCNHPDYVVPVPIGQQCDYCGIEFVPSSQGMNVPHGDSPGEQDSYHLTCFNLLVLGPVVAEWIESASGNAGEEVQQEAAEPG